MYATLFKQTAILARYSEAPYATERKQFLDLCVTQGYSHSMLKKIAWILGSISHAIDLDKTEVTKQDIENAVDGRTRFNCLSKQSQNRQGTRQMFVHIATEWIRSLGLLTSLPEPEHPFTAQVSAFCKYSLEERGLSPITIKTAQERLNLFFQSLHPTPDSMQTISINGVDAFLQSKGNQGWKRASLGALAGSLRSFFRYAEAQGWSNSGIAATIESPRLYAHEGLPLGPSWTDVQRLLHNTQGDSPADIRDHAILMLLAVYGFRRGEVAQLRLDDIDWINERIVVSRSKQNRFQSYPLVAAVGESILRYLQQTRPLCKHRSVFLSLAAPVRPLSASSITAIAHARLCALGIDLPRRGAHCLRHACAGYLLDSGFTMQEIGDHLGHRSVNSTFIYAKIDIAGLRQVAELDMGWLL